jgi:pimeloyl-ACP methyl ester carboxylesterase
VSDSGNHRVQRWNRSQSSRIIRLTGDLVFGNVAVGSSPTRTLTIHNDGNSPLTVSSINYPNRFSGNWSGTIPASGSQPVTVTFSPTAAQSYGGTITVNSDHTSGTNTRTCSGTGVEVALPDFIIQSITLNPANPVVGNTVVATIVMKNQGGGPGGAGYLDVWEHKPTAANVGEEGDAWFSVGTLAAGEAKTYTHQFTATTTGTRTFRAFVDSLNYTAESNENNNQRTQSYTVSSADNLGPNLSITHPAANIATNTPSITVSGTATDSGRGNSGISEVTVRVGSQTAVRASNDTATGANTANWSRNVTLAAGANTVTVVAKDNSPAKNATTLTRTVYFIDSPKGVTATENLTDKVQIDWIAVAGATAYDVYRGTSDNVSHASKITLSPISATSFNDTTVPAGQPHYYWVKAGRDGNGSVSAFSSRVNGLRAELPNIQILSKDTHGLILAGGFAGGGAFPPVTFDLGGAVADYVEFRVVANSTTPAVEPADSEDAQLDRWRVYRRAGELVAPVLDKTTDIKLFHLSAQVWVSAPWGIDKWRAARYEWEAYGNGGANSLGTGAFSLAVVQAETGTNRTTTPVLLLHGVFDSKAAWIGANSISSALGNDCPVYTMEYPNTDDIRISGQLLGKALEAVGDHHQEDSVHVVAHSMGGVVTRYYKERPCRGWAGAFGAGLHDGFSF